jgi:hypothetical protein
MSFCILQELFSRVFFLTTNYVVSYFQAFMNAFLATIYFPVRHRCVTPLYS